MSGDDVIPGLGVSAGQLGELLKTLDPEKGRDLLKELLERQTQAHVQQEAFNGGVNGFASPLEGKDFLGGRVGSSPGFVTGAVGSGLVPSGASALQDELDRILGPTPATGSSAQLGLPATDPLFNVQRTTSPEYPNNGTFSFSNTNSASFAAPEWSTFDPQVIELMSMILPQATDDFDMLQQYLPEQQDYVAEFEAGLGDDLLMGVDQLGDVNMEVKQEIDGFPTLATTEPAAASPAPPLPLSSQSTSEILRQAPSGLSVQTKLLAHQLVKSSCYVPGPASPHSTQHRALETMDWLVEPTKATYKDTLPLIAKVKPPELRLPESAIQILRTLDVEKVPCRLLRGKLHALKEKYKESDAVTLSDVEFAAMMKKRIGAMAKAMGKPKLSAEEEALLVDLMTSKATIECHASQLAGAIHDISELARGETLVDGEKMKKIEAAFSTCPVKKEKE